MAGGNTQWLTYPQAVKFRNHDIGLGAINFINDEMNTLTRCPQTIGNFLITRDQPITRIDHKQDNVCFFYGQPHLVGHKFINAFLISTQATRINHQIGAIAYFAFTVFSVTGETRLIRH